MQKKPIKITQIEPSGSMGRLSLNGIKPEDPEKGTLEFLASYGFIVEIIRPINTPKVKNPDVLIMGLIWEVKTPTTTNRKTLKKRFHKASLQSHQVIFDLRGIRESEYNKTEGYIIGLFEGNRSLRRMLLINKQEKILDFRK